jgi:hypothetical protein
MSIFVVVKKEKLDIKSLIYLALGEKFTFYFSSFKVATKAYTGDYKSLLPKAFVVGIRLS